MHIIDRSLARLSTAAGAVVSGGPVASTKSPKERDVTRNVRRGSEKATVTMLQWLTA